MAKKAQASIEFLMTYGWALVVIVIIIAALVVVMNPAGFVQNFCDVKLGDLMVQNFSASSSSLRLVITNNSAQNIEDLDFSLSNSATGSLPNQTMSSGETKLFTIPTTIAQGSYTIDINASYSTPYVSNKTAKSQCRGSL